MALMIITAAFLVLTPIHTPIEAARGVQRYAEQRTNSLFASGDTQAQPAPGGAVANVSPPLHASIDPVSHTLRADDTFHVRLSVMVPPSVGSAAKVVLTLRGKGALQTRGQTDWNIDHVESGRMHTFTATISVTGYGEGTVTLQARTVDAEGRDLWGKSDVLFMLYTPRGFLLGKSSSFELEKEMLSRVPMSRAKYEKQLGRLLEGKDTIIDDEIRRSKRSDQ